MRSRNEGPDPGWHHRGQGNRPILSRTRPSCHLSAQGVNGAAPYPPKVLHRQGGFGRAAGLADFLRHEQINLMIDATHLCSAHILECLSGRDAGGGAPAGAATACLAAAPWGSVVGPAQPASCRLAVKKPGAQPCLLALGGQGQKCLRAYPSTDFWHGFWPAQNRFGHPLWRAMAGPGTAAIFRAALNP